MPEDVFPASKVARISGLFMFTSEKFQLIGELICRELEGSRERSTFSWRIPSWKFRVEC
jgi:hypothetical protein